MSSTVLGLESSYHHLPTRFKVVAVLVNMVFALPGLTYSPTNVLQHLELFAGDCSVTRAEVAETRLTFVFIKNESLPSYSFCSVPKKGVLTRYCHGNT